MISRHAIALLSALKRSLFATIIGKVGLKPRPQSRFSLVGRDEGGGDGTTGSIGIDIVSKAFPTSFFAPPKPCNPVGAGPPCTLRIPYESVLGSWGKTMRDAVRNKER